MAHPFGAHPKFGEYIDWAEGQGLKVECGYVLAPDGRPHAVTKIVSKDGKRHVIEVGTQHEDHLLPTTIFRLDRRLGVRSPFFSLPTGPTT